MALPTFTPASVASKVILPPTGAFSNVSTSTLPFGIYINSDYWNAEQINLFKSGSVEQVAYVYKKLGGDVLDLEIVETQVHASYEEACLEYSYLINLHQSKNALPYFLGQATASFDNNGQLSGSNLPSDIALKLPKFNIGYAKNVALYAATEALVNSDTPIYSGSFSVIPGTQDYDLYAAISQSANANGWDIEGKKISIKKVYYKTSGASWNFYGYFGGLNVVGNLSTYGQYADDSTFEIIPVWQNKMQAMAYKDAIKTRVSDWSFQLRNNVLRLFPVPQASSANIFWFDFVIDGNAWDSNTNNGSAADTASGINNMNSLPFQNLPYDKINSIGKQWIRRFSLALCKEMLGQVRNKFGTIPIPGESVNLNGKDLISEGKEEQKELREELKTQLAEMTYVKLGEDTAKVSEDAQKAQTYLPNLIFIG
jgi:hypothetical protein